MTITEATEKMKAIGQEHVLKYFDELDEASKEALLTQIEETDFSVLDLIGKADTHSVRGSFSPLVAMQLAEIEKNREKYTDEGIKIIKEGKVAALLLAGGMGTRLGSDTPKGMYDIGETKHVYIFQRIIENLLDVVKLADTWITLFIMTSEKNHEATVSFFEEKDYFGYKKDKVRFFKQEMAPACDYTGKLFMETKSHISTSPNGNAGWYSSLVRAGLDKVIEKEGVEWINIFAVDNVLQRICDPCFVGATALAEVSVGAKVVKKAAPDEKVGVICLEDGRPSIVEYYELSDDMRDEKDATGDPVYNYGVILNYLFHVPELNAVGTTSMLNHLVEKKIPYIDESGNVVKPDEPNGYKFEQLVIDMIHKLGSCLPFEVIREKEFAPIKNATGVDSVDTARELCKKNGIEL
ncbi:MAG: UDPGP type 1 family protein [Eubacterium sp.]|nr:UDPGP type 1 family protein [Eubacterium sp.]